MLILIAKERTIPIRIQKNDALLRRLPKNHSKRAAIEQDQAKRMAGYRGEQSLDYYVSKLPEKDFIIFHGIRLTDGKYFFQMDTLILSPYFLLILEVKNFFGTLFFDPILNQLIQTTQNGEEKGYANPIEQANQQSRSLKKWLDKINIIAPIDFLVVISKPSTIIKTPPNNTHILQKVTHVQFLLSRIEKHKDMYKKEIFPPKELKKLTRLILKSHVPEMFDCLKHYEITSDELITGVICPNCFSYPVKRHYGTWFCLSCQYKNKNAHLQAVTDFFLLNNDTPISNQQFRDFLHLTSADVARKMLISMNLSSTGTNKGKVYLPPSNYQKISELNRHC